MLVYYFVPFIVSNRYLLFWVSNGHNSVTVQIRTHVYMNFFDHKDLGNHLLQLCPKVVEHPINIYCMRECKDIKLAVHLGLVSRWPLCISFEAFAVCAAQMIVLWIITPCRFIILFVRFAETCVLRFYGDWFQVLESCDPTRCGSSEGNKVVQIRTK